MSPWFDFLLVILALGAGWLGWVLFRLTSPSLRVRTRTRAKGEVPAAAEETSPGQTLEH